MEELERSLEAYEAQLEQIKRALDADPGNTDLKQLKADLDQVILLTSQSLLEEKKKELLDTLGEDNADKESIEEPREKKESSTFQEDLDKLVGMKCRAPHLARGSVEGTSASFSNAIVFHVEREAGDDMRSLAVRVVFSHPTSVDMVPCPYFLDGRCRFDDASCKYSHGEICRLEELAEYVEPDFGGLRAGSKVLAKRDSDCGDALWRHATVVEMEDKSPANMHVRFSHDHKDLVSLPIDGVWPLSGGGDEGAGSDGEDPGQFAETPNAGSTENGSVMESCAPLDLVGNLSSSSLGDWEKHTKGVASRMMAKMGYVTGSGLGRSGQGRVLPVPATVYPSGVSLDWCMEARAKAGGGDILSVEKTLARQKAKEEKRAMRQSAREAAREKRENSFFDFVNMTVSASGVDKARSRADVNELFHRRGRQKTKKKQPLKLEKDGTPSASSSRGSTSKDMNVKAFKISEDIRKAEKDVDRLEASLERHRSRGDRATAAGVEAKLRVRKEELAVLRGKEGNLSRAKSLIDGNKKLSIF